MSFKDNEGRKGRCERQWGGYHQCYSTYAEDDWWREIGSQCNNLRVGDDWWRETSSQLKPYTQVILALISFFIDKPRKIIIESFLYMSFNSSIDF